MVVVSSTTSTSSTKHKKARLSKRKEISQGLEAHHAKKAGSQVEQAHEGLLPTDTTVHPESTADLQAGNGDDVVMIDTLVPETSPLAFPPLPASAQNSTTSLRLDGYPYLHIAWHPLK
jgi:hypothetical protein